MIFEYWDYLTTPASSHSRKEGYLYHSVALAHRAKRCRKYWQSHIQQCQLSVIQKINKLSAKNSAVVLGSGLMIETPLEILATQFNKIDLVDVVHAKEVRKKIQKFEKSSDKFNLIELDLNLKFLEGKYDFVISANILSQLPNVIINRKIESKKISENEIQDLTFELQKRHLEQIKSLSENIFLFSDYELKIKNKKTNETEITNTVDPRLNLKWKNSWLWNIAPAPEISKYESVELKVGIALI